MTVLRTRLVLEISTSLGYCKEQELWWIREVDWAIKSRVCSEFRFQKYYMEKGF